MTRRLLYTAQYVAGFRNALQQAPEELHDMHFKHLCELADLRRELEETRAALAELRAAVRARAAADQELAELHREREIQRAQKVERDPALPLQ